MQGIYVVYSKCIKECNKELSKDTYSVGSFESWDKSQCFCKLMDATKISYLVTYPIDERLFLHIFSDVRM